MRGEFDAFRESYQDEVNRSIAFVGQDHRFFVEAKARHIVEVARRHLGEPGRLRALDVGCGVGLVDASLAGVFGSLCGVDVAAGALEEARRRNPGVAYVAYDGEALPWHGASFDLAFTVNVLHHVPPARREAFVTEMRRAVRPGGLGLLFEHNPLNPLTVRAVRRCAFDRGVTLSRRGTSRRLMARCGWRVAETRYILFFPWRHAALAAIERGLGWVPLGAQYYVAATTGGPRGAGHPPARLRP
jgi:SAM-dependent methyltransferase